MLEKEEDPRREVAARYANLKNQIMGAISKFSSDPFFRSPLEDLQKTVRSMEPMVKDMKGSERASPCHIFMTDKFLPLLEQVEALIRRFLENELPTASFRVGSLKASICSAFGIELPASSKLANSYRNDLEITRERLKDLFADYVKEELDKLALSNREDAVADEGMLEELLIILLPKIRDEASAPVFRKIKIILESLETTFHNSKLQDQTSTSSSGNSLMSLPPINRPRLFRLLKEVELLHRFLHGDHGLGIANHLQERENALRKFVTDKVVSRLKRLDRYYEKLRREREIRTTFMWLLLAVLMFGCLLDSPEYPSRPSDFVTLFIVGIFIVLLACSLAMKVSTHVRLGWSNSQGQSSNSDNPRCGGFLKLLVAVVGVIIVAAAAMVITDEPKKYDIFLNFRGSDEIRYSVAGVFHSGLEKANFSAFFDERSARKTKRFLKEIESAITTSVGAITIFSEYYGESEYCLDELLLILERQKTDKGYIIRPIFYDVEPDDLTNSDSKFGQGLQKHYRTQRKDKVEEWKEALDVITLIGGDVHKSDRHHLDYLVERVVEDFKNQLGNKRGTKDNTIQRWKSLIMKKTPPINLRLGNVKLSIDLWSWKLDVTVIPTS